MKKKILLITQVSTLKFGEESLGGVDSVCQDIIKSIVSQESEDYEYRVLAFDPASKSVYTGTVQNLSKNTSIVVAPCKERLIGLRMPGILSQLVRVHQQLKEFCPDIVHSHSENWLIGIRSRYKRIATLHGYKKICRNSVSAANDFFYVHVTPWLSKFFIDEFTCVGEIIRDSLKKDTRKAISIIRNPINNVFFTENNLKSQANYNFVTCSNLTPRKRLDRAISLIKSLNRSGINAQLSIIGSSSDHYFCNKLHELVKIYELSDNVRFLGRMGPKEIAKIYQESDFGVFLSEEETFGLAPLEMLASGLPIVATKTGLLLEEQHIFHNNGVLYYDDKTNTHEVINFINSRPDQTIKIPKKWITSNFSSDQIVSAYERVYKRLTS